ncbi:hypothetical protein [Paucibacter soli]|uniref:hypothetical protein n=1 Tax=Paucibacter soli TaxID=3133433 RepID=UPI003097C22E
MVTSIPSTSVATVSTASSALTQRPHTDEALKRQEAAITNKPATDEDTTVVQISQQGAKLAEQAVASQPAKTAPAQPSAEAGASAQASSNSKPEAAFEPADGNKDGSVTEFEQQAYDFKHPKSLAELIAEEKAAAANGLNVGLKAYEEVARSGRSA